MPDIPALSSRQFIRLLKKDGWKEHGRSKHGLSLVKKFDDMTKVAIVPENRDTLVPKTLGAILSVKQTGIGRGGLKEMIKKYGL